jgi:hypothetical protein
LSSRAVTDNVLNNLQDNTALGDQVSLFAFADSNVTEPTHHSRNRRSAKCKTAPDDILWPSDTIWSLFDLLLGGALEPVKPIASVCYPKSEYEDYDPSECANITANWSNGALQYVGYLFGYHLLPD